MDLGKYLWLPELKGKFFILDLPAEFVAKISNIAYDFRYHNYIEITVLEIKNVKNNIYLKTEYIKNIHIYDSNRKMIYRFDLKKLETDVESYVFGDVKWVYTFKNTKSFKQLNETVEPMLGSGLFDDDNKINYSKQEMKELLKNYE